MWKMTSSVPQNCRTLNGQPRRPGDKVELFGSAYKIESFRFYDENDYEYEIFSMLSTACAWGSVILAGKRGSRRHATTRFNKSVVAAGTSYQMLEVLAFWNRERAQPPSITITVLTFLVKKSTMKNSGVSIFWEYAKKLWIKSRTRSRPRPRI